MARVQITRSEHTNDGYSTPSVSLGYDDSGIIILLRAGQVVDVDDDLAKELVESGTFVEYAPAQEAEEVDELDELIEDVEGA